jgi:hypothetical protein
VERAMKRMEEQLEAWGRKIDFMVSEEQLAGNRPEIDALLRLDELKLLYAVAREKLDEFKAGEKKGAGERTLRKGELEKAWRELEAAFKKPAS